MQFAFAPLFPMTIRFFSIFLPIETSLIGIIINFICLIISATYLYKLTLFDHPLNIAFLAVLLFLINPAAIFYTANYTESLFFMTLVLSFYFIRQHKVLPACLFAMLAGAIRVQGIMLILPLTIEVVALLNLTKRNRPTGWPTQLLLKLTPMVIIPLGLILFAYIGYSATGNLAIITSTHQYFNRQTPNLLNIPITIIQNLTQFQQLPLHSFTRSKIDTSFLFINFVFIYLMFIKRFRISYIALSVMIVIIPLLTGSTMSLIRILSFSFPIYILVASFLPNHPAAKYAYLTVSIALMSIFSLLYINWFWVS
jgi:Gpi18-like mannosyltransferase